MDGDPHGPFFARENPGDEAHRCREREGAPGKEKCRADEHSDPVGDEDNDEIAEHGHEVENDQRTLVAESVAQVAAGKGVECGEEIVHAVEETDREDAAPEGEEIDREEPFGHLFPEADEDRHEQERHDASFQAEEIRNLFSPSHKTTGSPEFPERPIPQFNLIHGGGPVKRRRTDRTRARDREMTSAINTALRFIGVYIFFHGYFSHSPFLPI